MTKKWTDVIQLKTITGQNALSASAETSFWEIDDSYKPKMNALLRQIATSGDAALRSKFLAGITAPIMSIIPYVTLYDRFFIPQTYGLAEDIQHTTDTVINVVYESHRQAEVFFNQPNLLFSSPTLATFNAGFRIPWDQLAFANAAGWDALAKEMNQCMWELARKRDAKAKTVLDTAITLNHTLNHTGGLVKSVVDYVVRKSNEIGFPVTQAVINPGRLMEMQSWSWVMPNIPPEVANQLIFNFYVGNYAGIDWFVNPNASANTVYFGGPASQIGWHDMKGDERVDRDTDITKGDDLVAIRDKYHAWSVQVALSLWVVNII